MFKQKIINTIKEVQNDLEVKKKFIKIKDFIKLKNQPLIDFTNTKTNRNFSNLVYQVVGIYCLVNLREQIIYVGQTQNLSERFDFHRLNFFSGKHEILQLQKDFKNELKSQDFQTIHENLFSTTFFYTPLQYELLDSDISKLDSLLKQVEKEIIIFFVKLNYKVYNDPTTFASFKS